jgi:hypothetical protein
MQNSALEAEVQRLKRQETANFAAFKRVTEEKLSYMQKLAEAEGEAFMSTVLLRKVSLPPPAATPHTRGRWRLPALATTPGPERVQRPADIHLVPLRRMGQLPGGVTPSPLPRPRWSPREQDPGLWGPSAARSCSVFTQDAERPAKRYRWSDGGDGPAPAVCPPHLRGGRALAGRPEW